MRKPRAALGLGPMVQLIQRCRKGSGLVGGQHDGPHSGSGKPGSELPQTGDPAVMAVGVSALGALIGGFARNNPVNFHATDGSGYRFVAEQVLALDALNPQVASRMAGAFQQWRRFEAHRRGLMQATLQELAAHSALSSELREVVERSLAS